MGLQQIEGAVALVTGSNRGIGKAFVEALLRRNVKRIYTAVRDLATAKALQLAYPEKTEVMVPVQIDITNPSQIQKAAERCQDVTLLINNAGICQFTRTVQAAREEFETNCLGPWAMSEAFAPILAKNGGGAIVNILSAGALVNSPVLGSYCVSKAALHSMTQMFRALLAAQGTLVAGVYAGSTDTDLMKHYDLPKVPPSQIAEASLAAVVKGIEDVYPDDYSANLRDALAADPKAVEKQLAAYI